MQRRSFLTGIGTSVVGFAAPGSAHAQDRIDARLTVAYDASGMEIPSDFIGLSYESAVLADAGYFAADNQSVLGLIGLLGRNGVIRIGGNTSERTVWRASDEPAPPGSFGITP